MNPRFAARRPVTAGLPVALAVSLLLTACASPRGIAPSAQLRAPTEVGLTADAPAASVPADWWTQFDDPALNALIGRAVADSPTIKIAQSRLERAAAGVAGASADAAPRVDGSVEIDRQRYSATGLYPPPLAGAVLNSGTVQATLRWDLDLFGRHRAELAAALGEQRSAQAEAAEARLMLASTIARQWFVLARLAEQRGIAERTLTQRDEVYRLVHQRVDAGLDTSVELRQSQGSLPEARAQIEALDEQMTLARHALAALSAQPPNALDGVTPAVSTTARAAYARSLPTALPLDLLAQRPDVVAARWRVESATQQVAAARTGFYPNVNLMAFAGLNAIGLNHLFDSDSRAYGVGPAISLPLFDAGRLRAGLRGRTADLDAAVERYNAAVLDAVHDTTDQISTLQSLARQQQEQDTAQFAAEQAYDLALQRYRAGIGTYLVVLTAENNVLLQRRAAADLRGRLLEAQVGLARALGGGTPPAAS